MKRCQALTPQLEQRANILFCFKLGWTFKDIKAALTQVYQERTLCDASIYHWICEYQKGCTRVVDKQRSPRNKSSRSRANVRRVEDMVEQDRSITIARMSFQSGISATSIHRILKLDLHLVKKCAIFVPHVLEEQHKECRVMISNFMVHLTTQSL